MADIPKKPPRPRDELGRPQPRDTENTLQMENYDALSPEENHRLGREHFRAGRFFPAHEAWETVWKQRKGDPLEEFWKGLSQLGAGYVHLHRGNAHGAMTLLRRAGRRIGRYPKGTEGVDTETVSRTALEQADQIEEAASGHERQARGVVDPGGYPPPSV
jgi:predicted metal-dependent hydrolase